MNQLFKWSPPAFIPTESWEAFVEMRKAKGKRAPFTDKARDILVKQLAAMHERGISVGDALDQSTVNGWSGVFEPRGPTHSRRETASANQAFTPSSKQGAALANMQRMKRGAR